MSAQPVPATPDDLDDDAERREIDRARTAHRRAEREAALGLPPRPRTRDRTRPDDDLGWHNLAACRDPEPEDAETFVEARSQAEAADLVEVYCNGARPCPVRARCVLFGRTTHGSGVYGGVVLVDGFLAPERPPTPRRPRRLATAPEPEQPEPTEQPKAKATGQRGQPRRALSRARRRKGRA